MNDRAVVKNAIIKLADIFADNTYVGVVFIFDYGDGTQQSGPHVLSEKLVRGVLAAAGTNNWSELVGSAVRVKVGSPHPDLDPLKDIPLEIGHLLTNDLWYTL